MRQSSLLLALLLVAGCAAPLAQLPPAGMPAQVSAPQIRPGDGWQYAMHDGYTGLPRGTLEYRVRAVEGDTVTVEFKHGEHQSVQLYTRDLNWRERPMTNLQNFRFDPPYPALPFPLAPGKTWTAYVRATDPANGRVNRVRVDGKVLGWERVKVPAGAFDAIVVQRLVYAGNDDYMREEENITEIDWFAPKLGAIVRHSGSSAYYDKMKGCDGPFCTAWTQNDWNVVELLAYQPADAAGTR